MYLSKEKNIKHSKIQANKLKKIPIQKLQTKLGYVEFIILVEEVIYRQYS